MVLYSNRELASVAELFWQPTISVGDKTLSAEEQPLRSEMDQALVDLHAAVYRNVELAAPHYENLYYITDVFDEQDSHIWIDSHHVTPERNQLIGDTMLDAISKEWSAE